MARETDRNLCSNRLWSAALVGALSLSLLPVAAGAQFRMPGLQTTPPQPTIIRPSAPSPSPFAMPPLFRPAFPAPSFGGFGGFPEGTRSFDRAPMPGYGNGLNGGLNGGNLFNRNGVDFNSLFQHRPNGLNGNNSLLMPDISRNPGAPGYNSLPQSNLGQGAPNIAPDVRRYSTRAAQPTISNSSSYNRFNLSAEGHAYRLHHLAGAGWDIYFPYGAAYYSSYYPDYAFGLTAASPYYYYGTFPPYIGASGVYNDPPQYIYVPYPVYTPDGQYSGDRPDDVDNYYLNQSQPNRNQSNQDQPGQNQSNQNQQGATSDGETQQDGSSSYRIGENTNVRDALLNAAVSDLNKAWQNADIEQLSKHIRKDARIAVYLRGKYQYSLDAGDYLDMTRDAFRATKTVSFKLDSVQRKENGVYTVSGRHTYTDQKGKSHTVLVSYVLEKVSDEYYITQVGTAPQILEQ